MEDHKPKVTVPAAILATRVAVGRLRVDGLHNTGEVVKQMLEDVVLAHRLAASAAKAQAVLDAVGEVLRPGIGGPSERSLIALSAAYDRCAASDTTQEPDPDTEQHGLAHGRERG